MNRSLALFLLVLIIITAGIGFSGRYEQTVTTVTIAGIAKLLNAVCIALFLVSLLFGRRTL